MPDQTRRMDKSCLTSFVKDSQRIASELEDVPTVQIERDTDSRNSSSYTTQNKVIIASQYHPVESRNLYSKTISTLDCNTLQNGHGTIDPLDEHIYHSNNIGCRGLHHNDLSH